MRSSVQKIIILAKAIEAMSKVQTSIIRVGEESISEAMDSQVNDLKACLVSEVRYL